MPNYDTVAIPKDVYIDMRLLTEAATAQDSPESPFFYLEQIKCRLDALRHQYPGLRDIVEKYLAEKEYLPPAPPIEFAKG